MIIGCCGLIGSGKNTVADYLIHTHGFQPESFAGSLKDAVAAVFSWDRTLLEGSTIESREWRDSVDTWWAQRLDIEHLTPRWVLQNWGTNVLRQHFHNDIWIASVQRRLLDKNTNTVITDLRFPNEFRALDKINAIKIRVKRGKDPDWFKAAAALTRLSTTSPLAQEAQTILENSNVHESEWAWAGQHFDYTLANDATLAALYEKVDDLLYSIRDIRTAAPNSTL